MTKWRGRGEGSIEILPSGKFRVVLSAETHPETGERQKLMGTFTTKKETLQWRNEQLNLLRTGRVIVSGVRKTVADWMREWLETVKPTVAKHTYLPYERDCLKVIVPKLGHLKLALLTATAIERFYAQLSEEGMSAAMTRLTADTYAHVLPGQQEEAARRIDGVLRSALGS